jgi:hypothetical protein
MRYSLCNDTATLKLNETCLANFIEFKSIDRDLQFATAVTIFGLKIKQSKYIKSVNWQELDKIARESYDPASYLQTEFLQLINKAQDIYTNKKRKKNNND